MNVILITIDSLRADHIGSLGYAKELTPNLDKIADEGVLFTQAFSCGPNTILSIVPMLMSSYFALYFQNRSVNKIRTMNELFSRYKDTVTKLNRRKPPIAEVLKNKGYKTSAFHSNPFLSKYYNIDKGFSYYDDSFTSIGKHCEPAKKIGVVLSRNKKLTSLARRFYWICCNKVSYVRAETINKKVISWLKKYKKENFFIWIHYMDTHIPYFPPAKFCNRLLVSNMDIYDIYSKMNKNEKVSQNELNAAIFLYDGTIRYIDYAIGELIKKMDELSVLDDTIIIITADHGDEFGEHEGFVHSPKKLYDELIHVPLIIYNAEHKNIVVDKPVSLLDIAPTITDLLNLPVIKTFHGRSLIPVIKGEKITNGIISEGFDPQEDKIIVSFRDEEWKYIFHGSSKKHELYNIKNDPRETKNLYEEEEEKAKEYESKIIEHISNQQKLVAMDIEREKIRRKIKKLREVEKTT